MADPEKPIRITETRESDLDHEAHVSAFDYLVDKFLDKTMTLEEVIETYHEIEDFKGGRDG